MSKEDYSTSTVDGAAAHAAKFAEPYDKSEGWDGDMDVPPPDLDETRTSTWEELYQFLHKLQPHQRKGYVNVLLNFDIEDTYHVSGVAVACEVAEHLWGVEQGELILCLEE